MTSTNTPTQGGGMSATPAPAERFVPFCEHVCEALDLWFEHGALKLRDTAWRNVDLCNPDEWPTDREIEEDSGWVFTRSDVEGLLLARKWLHSAFRALDKFNNKEVQANG